MTKSVCEVTILEGEMADDNCSTLKLVDGYAKRENIVSNVSLKEASVSQLVNELVSRSKAKNDLSDRYNLFPIKNDDIYEFYKRQEIAEWTCDEMEFIRDKHDYEDADAKTAALVEDIISFFLPGDGAISLNIIFRFLLECETFEESAFLISQLRMELIHAETYGLIAYTMIPEDKMEILVRKAQNSPFIKAQLDFMEEFMLSDIPKAERYLAFACAEGIFFCALFIIIFWFRKRGLFKNFTFANQLISADESLHAKYGYNRHIFYGSCSEERAKEICMRAYNLVSNFVQALIPEPIEELNSTAMCEYVKLITDITMVNSGHKEIFNAVNPFDWMDEIVLQQKNNIYEVRGNGYVRASLSDVVNWRKRAGKIQSNNDVYDRPDEVDF